MAIFSSAQDYKKLDSLFSELNNQHHDTIKFELLLQIGDYYYFNDFKTANDYFVKAKELAESKLEDGDEALKRKYIQQRAKAIRYIAYVYLNQGDYLRASELYFEALGIGESINCNTTIYNCYNNIAILNHLRKEYTIAEGYYKKALEITEKTGDKFGKSKLLINLGVMNYDHGNATDSIAEKEIYFNNAYNNYIEALKLKTDFNDTWGQLLCYNNLGNVTRDGAKHIIDSKSKAEDLYRADEFYKQAFDIASEIKDYMTLSKVYGNLAEVYIMLYPLETIKTDDKETLLDSAKHYATQAYRYADELNSLPQKNDAANTARIIFEIAGEIENALKYASLYIETNAELFTEEKTRSLDEMRVKYETEKKENEIELLNSENELKEIRIRNAKREGVLYIILAISFLALSVLMFKLYKNHKSTAKILEGKNSELSVLNSTKDKFISILAHDLRNPFNAFLNITEALHNEYDNIDESKRKKYIERMHRSSAQLNNLLKNMLEWAILKHKTGKAELVPLHLNEIVVHVCETLSGFMNEKNVHVEFAIANDVEVLANRSYLLSVLNNLITNAVKFSENGGKLIITAKPESEKVLVTVADNGVGIAPQDIGKLFRIDVDTRTIGKPEGKGTGMGLILCRELLEKMNGQIWVESEMGKGSRFIFTLPLKLDSN